MDNYERIARHEDQIAVIGLGYVGLPIAVALSEKAKVIGYDHDAHKIQLYQQGVDLTGDIGEEKLHQTTVQFTADEQHLAKASFYIIAVPTPIAEGNVPDLAYVKAASRMVGRHLKSGDVVVYESTVYPGVTEEICQPILEQESGLSGGTDFKIGYSPERINPGDKEHHLDNIVKIVSGMDEETLETVAKVYEMVVHAGVHRAPSIRVAEAAKVIENAQRDVNIAFMNELAMLFHHMDIDTQSVLAAAGTKWNFLPFQPGLVGGHCIGIDPYYLTYKAEDSGYYSKIILAGRHINDSMGKYVAQQIVKQLMRSKQDMSHAKVGILGLSYKENSADIRNSKVIDIIQELHEYGIETIVCDPVVDAEAAKHEYGLELQSQSALHDLSMVVVAVGHDAFTQWGPADFASKYASEDHPLFIDLKGIYDKAHFEAAGFQYWRL